MNVLILIIFFPPDLCIEKILKKNNLLGETKIEHFAGRKLFSEKNPEVVAVNQFFKLKIWCWNKDWYHCY